MSSEEYVADLTLSPHNSLTRISYGQPYVTLARFSPITYVKLHVQNYSLTASRNQT